MIDPYILGLPFKFITIQIILYLYKNNLKMNLKRGVYGSITAIKSKETRWKTCSCQHCYKKVKKQGGKNAVSSIGQSI